MKTMMIALMVLIAASPLAIDPITDGSVPEGFEDVELTGYVDYRWEDRDLGEKVLLQILLHVFAQLWRTAGSIRESSFAELRTDLESTA